MPQPQDITVFYEPPDLEFNAIKLVVTLPTFRRPDCLTETLKSLTKQVPARQFAVIVMENDTAGMAGAEAAKAFFIQNNVCGLVILAHERGNCNAYNAGLHTAMQRFTRLEAIAVIDDDEQAATGWLANLLATQAATGADCVGGPQVPVFEAQPSIPLHRHPVFMPHYRQTGPVPILYSSGNVLISRRVLDAMPQPYLDTAFNFIGGGDSDFYRRCRTKGFRFAWCAEATVTEVIPTRRTQQSWINARSQRNGAISTLIEHRQNPSFGGRVRTLLKSLALLGASPFRGVRLWRQTGLVNALPHHVHVAIGRLLAEFGKIGEQYRNPESN